MGLGVAVLPDWLVRVLPEWHATPLPANVVYPGQRMLPARVRTFIDFAVTYIITVLRDASADTALEQKD
jgi:DNA-binding transcriptional LysR family regulator